MRMLDCAARCSHPGYRNGQSRAAGVSKESEMASIALTVIGSAIGGPIGGAIGAILGQKIDNSILGPKANEGPRLKELNVQTSSYGSSIPAIFGAMRVAGTVIWATDLVERREKQGNGKGRPKTINFSYSANLAIALSSRPLARIGRIWADGNLLRGAAGDFKVQTGFRFYSGHTDQPLDPLIASAQATGESSAHRGLAYVVFEDLQLADFGNHIPSLTFEVFERETDVPLTVIFSAASDGKIGGVSSESLVGFALDGRNAKSALMPIVNNFPIILRPKNAQLEIVDWSAGAVSQSTINPATSVGSSHYERPSKQRMPAHKIPNAIGLRHYEPARDFQIGVQRSERYNGAQTSQVTDLPAALSASAAQRLADLQLLQMQYGRNSWTAIIANGPNPLFVGDWIVDDEGIDTWRVLEIEHLQGATSVTATRFLRESPSLVIGAEPGASIPSVDILAGQTLITLMDLPITNQIDPGHVLAVVATTGTNSSWRNAALSWNQNNQLTELGSTASSAIMGSAITALAPHSAYLTDYQNSVDIQFPYNEIELPAGTGSPNTFDAPICWLSGELIRYGQASYLGQGRYRLSNLLRGCFGSESHIGAHIVGDRFVLLDSAQLRLLDDVPLSLGQSITIEALGLGDENPVAASTIINGNAIKPFAPVHGIAKLRDDGGLDLEWKRRSRINYGWQDGVDQPLVEENENYTVGLLVAGTNLANWVVSVPNLSLSPLETALIPMATNNWSIEICQTGRFGVSLPLRITKIVF
jgi:Putative phage tail protein